MKATHSAPPAGAAPEDRPPLDIARLRGLLAAAGDLPWATALDTHSHGRVDIGIWSDRADCYPAEHVASLDHAELMVAAVNALPELLDELDQHRHQVDRLSVDCEHNQRTIHDLQQQLRVTRADLAAAIATDDGSVT